MSMRRPTTRSEVAGPAIWDIIKVPFPYTNRPVQQFRPALVIARSQNPGAPILLWVLMITSASHRRWIGDIEISDLVMAGLPAASIIRSAKVATVEAQDADTIGCLPPSDRFEVRTRIAALLAAVLE